MLCCIVPYVEIKSETIQFCLSSHLCWICKLLVSITSFISRFLASRSARLCWSLWAQTSFSTSSISRSISSSSFFRFSSWSVKYFKYLCWSSASSAWTTSHARTNMTTLCSSCSVCMTSSKILNMCTQCSSVLSFFLSVPAQQRSKEFLRVDRLSPSPQFLCVFCCDLNLVGIPLTLSLRDYLPLSSFLFLVGVLREHLLQDAHVRLQLLLLLSGQTLHLEAKAAIQLLLPGPLILQFLLLLPLLLQPLHLQLLPLERPPDQMDCYHYVDSYLFRIFTVIFIRDHIKQRSCLTWQWKNKMTKLI